MASIKLVLIGAGSAGFTTSTMADLIVSQEFAGSTVVLVDIDETRLDGITRLTRRMVQERNAELTIEATTDRRRALPGANFVIATIAIDHHNVWGNDIAIPLKYGIAQSVGDSTGPGGILRALRTIPLMVDIACDMEELCPEAWLLNYTNPMSTICRALNRSTDIRTVGLCHGLRGTRRRLAQYLEVREDELSLHAAGINHLTWVLDMRLRGEDAYPLLRERLADKGPEDMPVSFELFRIYGLFPSPGDVHVAEFFPFFLLNEDERREYGLPVKDVDARAAGQEKRWERIQRQIEGSQPIEDLFHQSVEHGAAIISAVVHDRNEMHMVNVPNRGCILNLPNEAVVEVPGAVGGYGIKGVAVGELPEAIAGVLTSVITAEELTVEAALTGDKDVALQALLADPLVNSIKVARQLLDEMLEAEGKYLPQFDIRA